MRRPQTIKTCTAKGCIHLSMKGPVGFCGLIKQNLIKVKKCPRKRTVEPGYIPKLVTCMGCEQLKLKDEVWICKKSGYRPHMMRYCPKNEEIVNV